MNNSHRSIDESIGQTFNELTVLSFNEYKITPRGKKVPHVNVICSCGKERSISLWDVKSGKTKTCGLDHPTIKDRSLPAFNAIYNSYIRQANLRGYIFDINKEQFRSLTQQKCYYCGVTPSNNSVRGIKSGRNMSYYAYNGLDRIDNSIGYLPNNVVACCDKCNHAKHTMSQSEFIELARKIAAKHTPNLDREGP